MAGSPNKLSKNIMLAPYTQEYLNAEHNPYEGLYGAGTAGGSRSGLAVGQGGAASGEGAAGGAGAAGAGASGRRRGRGAAGGANADAVSASGNASKFPKNAAVVEAYPDKRIVRKRIKKMNRRAQKERDYFFVMRKGICFFMFLFCLLIIAVMGVNMFASNQAFNKSLLPTDSSVDEETAVANKEILGYLNRFTAVYVTPDNTPQDVRTEYEGEIDEEGYYKIYEDKSEFYGYMDPFYGTLKSIGLVAKEPEVQAEAETEDKSDAAKETATDTTETATDTAAETESTEITFDTTLYDSTLAYLENITNDDDAMAKPATIIFKYSSLVAYPVIFITALVAMFTSFIGMFGRRIYKGFGAAAIIILVMLAIVAFSGLAVLGSEQGAPYYSEEDAELHSIVNADNLGDFILHSITGAPVTEVDPAVDVAPVTFCLGYGTLIITGLAVLLLVFSIFARRKLPYSIFDK